LPTPDDVALGTRFFRLAPAIEAMLWILDYALETARTRVAHMNVKIVCRGVLVDVDHTARHDLHTGIQQVVRQVLPLWAREHPIVPVVWTDGAQAMRTLSPAENDRILHWDRKQQETVGLPDASVLVVPWQSVVVLPEVPFPGACERLAALAQFSSNAVVAVGYDCIPAVSADMVPAGETNRFARYLVVVKHARRIASIGATATAEFRGFAAALPAQGLTGPLVAEVPLPVGADRSTTSPDAPKTTGPAAPPLVLCVGTFEPRKNQMALLYAAERLWREGLLFELLLIGGAGWGDWVPRTIAQLKQKGRPVHAVTKATGAQLDDAYNRARFTVFASLHEGFGLPVAESFEHGTPVITTKYGSTGEIAIHGGAILIDPRNDEELVAAMRTMLVDDDLVRQLRLEIRARPTRTWADYATELWDSIVTPELGALG
jgi:glycosyltransferase involved in cell wall biosynthesis